MTTVIVGMTLATMASRFAPFLLFSRKSESPHIQFLGRFFPAGMMAILVLYCLKGVDWTGPCHGWPALAGIAAVLGLHVKWRNAQVSIFLGTAVYIALSRWGQVLCI